MDWQGGISKKERKGRRNKMKGHLEGIVVTVEPTDFYDHSFYLSMSAYVNGLRIDKRGMFFDDRGFEDSFSLVFDHVKQTILDQIKKLDAVNWDKDEIQKMIVKEEKT